MTSLTLPRPAIRKRFEGFWKSLALWRNYATPPDDPQEEACARRDFILEMLDRHPDAFQSELDTQNIARLYRGKF